MITSNSTHKLKAFHKSTRDLGDIKDEVESRSRGTEKEKPTITSSDNGPQRSISSLVICPRDRPDNKLRPRQRVRDDFRMPRGNPGDRRAANVRGRGAGFNRKVERENETTYVPRGKYQDSSTKNCSENVVPSSKYYSESESSKSKVGRGKYGRGCAGIVGQAGQQGRSGDYGYPVSEDSRISKLLRRLCREDDQEKFVSLAKQLQESLMLPENNRYIRRSLDLICESLLDLLHTGPGLDAKHLASRCLGRVGYALDQDFKRFVDWIFSTYAVERNEDVRLLLMKAVYGTLKLDEETLKLKDFASMLMTNLQNALEYTDSSEFLIGTVDVILLLTDMYPATFTKHFRDTVDILVGWHIDCNQRGRITKYASQSLQRLSQFWIVDLQFSVTLLSQFLEDMEAYGEDLNPANSGRSSPDEDPPLSPDQCVEKITSLIKVFNTVLKCLGRHLNPGLSPEISWNFLTSCFTKLLHNVLKAMDSVVKEELIIAANEGASLLLHVLQTKVASTDGKLYTLIDLELKLAPDLEEDTLISILRLIEQTVCDVSANLPIEMVQEILSPGSSLLALRFSNVKKIQKEVLAVYHSFLNLKNIPPLQEAYRYVLGDLEVAYRMILPSIPDLCTTNPHAKTSYSCEDAEIVVMFHLKALADLGEN